MTSTTASLHTQPSPRRSIKTLDERERPPVRMSTATLTDLPTDPYPLVEPHPIQDPDGTGILMTENLNVWFGKRKVLEGVNLGFPENTVTALIGPSGCGKSSFLRTLNRLHELAPTAALAGTVQYDGTDIYEPQIDPVWVRSQIGMVFQKPNPFPSMTIRGNVLSGLVLAGRKISRSDADQLMEESLRAAGLWDEVKDRLGIFAGDLSGGQQQRLVIARALAVNPKVLLMDEPCSSLDPSSTLKVEDTIRELRESITIVLVTHNMHQALRVSDYTAFFLAGDDGIGKVIEHGHTDDVFFAPNDTRTEDYVAGRFG